MFKEMRRKDRQLDRKKVIEILQQGDYGVLSILGENGYPYGVPLNYIMMGEDLYFHSAMKGQKIDDIQHNNKVSFCVVENPQINAKEFSADYSSVIVFGKAVEVGGEEKQRVLQGFINKFSPDYIKESIKYIEKKEKGTKVIKIEIEHVTGKARNG